MAGAPRKDCGESLLQGWAGGNFARENEDPFLNSFLRPLDPESPLEGGRFLPGPECGKMGKVAMDDLFFFPGDLPVIAGSRTEIDARLRLSPFHSASS